MGQTHSNLAPHPPGFELPEEAVANTLGMSRRELSAHRGPENGRWAFGLSRRIFWSASGVAALQLELGAEKPPDTPTLPPDCVRLVVVRSRLPNRKVLLARLESGDAMLTVYLGANGDNRRWRPGYLLLARPHRGSLYVFEGRPDHPELGRRQPSLNPNHWPQALNP